MPALRRTSTPKPTCLARQGKLCRCGTCSASFASTATTVSDVSTTCPPSELDDRSHDFDTPSRARGQPLQAFPTNTTILESVYDYQDNEASAGEFVGPDGRYMSPSQNPINLPPSRTSTMQSLARTDTVSSVASDRTFRSPKSKAVKRIESVVSNATVTTVDEYEYEEPATYLPPMQGPTRSKRVQRLAPTQSDYNLTPTAAFPLGRPANRKRWENAKVSPRC